ncbi:DUF2125 domain-containing protein [Rhizobium sp. ARZ01]|uniref:DUF2125 domain-containing protein n=1 Tax=Rhizobium sp. ARZ01 TaxID=2769313 RepID=UPI00177F6B55|nr:DUF2125 domain-containing protein [Rhizobium sp. ARZ01]MBD9374912.1 DUF2125 domain-containing protein [Rhizobium sp. ARZ01]
MTSTNSATSSGSARKFWLLGLGIVVFVAAYTGAWFFGADRLKGLVRDRLSSTSTSVSCTALEVKGYPFRIGLFCDAVAIDDERTGTSASFGALRSAAQVYNPGHAVVELDGPALIRVSPDKVLTADWNLLHASGVAGMGGLDRASIAYDALKGSFTAGMRDVNLGFAASHGEIHTRTNGTALDVAMSINGLELTIPGTQVPAIDVALHAAVADGANWLKEGPPKDLPRGTKGDLRSFSVNFADGNSVSLSGPYEIDNEGLLSGKFELEFKGIDSVRDIVSKAFPEIAETANSVTETVRTLSGGDSNARVKLLVQDGVVYLGIIPIANIGAL